LHPYRALAELPQKRSRGLKVARTDCEAVLNFLRERDLIVRGLRILRFGCSSVVPVARQLSTDEAAGLTSDGITFEEAEVDFPALETRPRSLLEYLGDKLPSDLLASVPRSYDIIGDIAIVELPHELGNYRALVGEAAMNVHRRLRLVLNKTSAITGKFRVGKYEIIAGQGPTETLHREHGCIYKLDPTKVFFTPRLSTERARVASQVNGGEAVGDLFAGVGPFSILIARTVPGVKVYSIDINPFAFRYLEENIRLNGVEGKAFAILGDAAEVAESELKGICNRVIMNMPAGSELFLKAASSALLPEGGIVHLHVFVDGLESLKGRTAMIEERMRMFGWKGVSTSQTRLIREVGVRSYHVAIDISLNK